MSSIGAARIFLAVGGEMSSGKLRRIICIAHESHIRETDRPLIQGDTIEAWEQGPVFANLCRLIGDSDGRRVIPEDLPDGTAVFDECTREYAASACKVFKGVSGECLSCMANGWRSPWRMARKGICGGGFFDWLLDLPRLKKSVISNSMIRHCVREV